MPSEDLQRLARVIMPPTNDAAWTGIRAAFADAFRLLASRAQAEGLSEKLRSRSRPGPVSASPFFRLARFSDEVSRRLDRREGPGGGGPRLAHCLCLAGTRWPRSTVGSSEGVSTGIVYGLEVLERCLRRMEQMVDVLDAASDEARAAAFHRLLAQVVLSSHKDRSLSHLIAWNTHLLQRKIVERTGKTGEHYIAANRAEYRHIWLAAAGAVWSCWAPRRSRCSWPASVWPRSRRGFWRVSITLSASCCCEAFGLMLATKQPAMTGAKLAEIVRELRASSGAMKSPTTPPASATPSSPRPWATS